MAQEKDERSGTAMRKVGGSGEGAAKVTAPAPGGPASKESATGSAELTMPLHGERSERYLVGIRMPPPTQAFVPPHRSMDDIVAYLKRQEGVEVVGRIKLGRARPFAAEVGSDEEVVVAKIPELKAQRLRAIAPADLIIERDGSLRSADYLPVPARNVAVAALLPLRPVAREVSIRVVGAHDKPLARALVLIDGGGIPAQGFTDENGQARLTYFGGPIETLQTLFVRPAIDHWDRVMHAPQLRTGINTVRMRPLAESRSTLPHARLSTWNQRLMGLEPGGGRRTANGVKIGLIDSGCDNSHPLLRHITHGKDFTGGAETSWTEDSASQGTHSAGIISAMDVEPGSIGCAPDAELYICKVLPQGRVSDLLAALDECIAREVDVIHIGVVTDGYSELARQKLQEARHKGIATVVAAGNSGGAVSFPAMVSEVMAVAAVGKATEFPADSSHALNVAAQLMGHEEVFMARFSATGPQIAVCAPGVAVVSTAPGAGFAAVDGTCAAAAHVAGFAAVVLAQHPLFNEETAPLGRSELRVRALFDLIRASAVAYYPDPRRAGSGVPNLARVPWALDVASGMAMAARSELMTPSVFWPAYARVADQHFPPPWLTTQGAAVSFY